MDDSQQPRRRTSRACENCKRRKVKCNGNPEGCQQCNHLNLTCVYLPIKAANKSRSHAVRGSVISRLKNSQPSPESTTSSSSSVAEGDVAPPSRDEGLPSLAAQFLPQSSCYTKDFFRSLIGAYEEHVYCVNPVVTSGEMLLSIDRMDRDLVDFSLVHAFGALTLNLTTPNWKSDVDQAARIQNLLYHATSSRSDITSGFSRGGFPSALNERFIMTAIFIEICLEGLDKYEEAFFVLREAVAMIQLLRVDRLCETSSAAMNLTPAERAKRIRLYWEAFIHERFLTIMAYVPPVLPPLPCGVPDDNTIPPHVQEGFRGLVQLFRIIDVDFVRHWNATDRSDVTAQWIESKRREVEIVDFPTGETPSTAVSGNWRYLTTLQKADLIVTRHWILTLLWQLAISNCLLPSQPSSNPQVPHAPMAMSLQLPIRLSQQLHQVVTQLGRQSIECNGSGIVQKLFEMTNTIADVIIHVPATTADDAARRRDDFGFLLDFLRTFASLNEVQLRMLAEKALAVSRVFG